MHEEEIFHKAIAIQDADERAAFLNEVCFGDEPRRNRLERLIRSWLASGQLLDPLSVHSVADINLTESIQRHVGESDGVAPDELKYFGDFEIVNVIARGGMGVVYKARQKNLDRLVAIKMILAGMDTDQARQRFQLEAEAAAQLDHPGIVPLYEVGSHDGKPYLAMALVEGCSLAERIQEERLNPRDAVKLVQQIARAVEYAHGQGIMHRDLKPANILLDEKNEPRITDFGIARRMDRQQDLTSTGQIVGTPAYMAPEQVSLENVSLSVDIYALGAILFAALTGRAPFESESTYGVLKKLVEQPAPPPSQFARGIPRDLDCIVLKALDKNPSARFQSAREFVEELQRFLDGEPVQSQKSPWSRFLHQGRSILASTPDFIVMSVGTVLVILACDQSYLGPSRRYEWDTIKFYRPVAFALLGLTLLSMYCYGARLFKPLIGSGIALLTILVFQFFNARFLDVKFAAFGFDLWWYGIPGALLVTLSGWFGNQRSKTEPSLKLPNHPWTRDAWFQLAAVMCLALALFYAFCEVTTADIMDVNHGVAKETRQQFISFIDLRDREWPFSLSCLVLMVYLVSLTCGARKRLLSIIIACSQIVFMFGIMALYQFDLFFNDVLISHTRMYFWLVPAFAALSALVCVYFRDPARLSVDTLIPKEK